VNRCNFRNVILVRNFSGELCKNSQLKRNGYMIKIAVPFKASGAREEVNFGQSMYSATQRIRVIVNFRVSELFQ
jgi:hypothetical protein